MIPLRAALMPGAEETIRAFRSPGEIPGDITVEFDYPCLQDAITSATAQGEKVYDRLTTVLDGSASRRLCGSKSRLREVWEQMIADGTVEQTSNGPQDLIDRARDEVFGAFVQSCFERRETIQGSDVSGEADIYCLRWQNRRQAVDLQFSSQTSAWIWIGDRISTSLNRLFEPRIALRLPKFTSKASSRCLQWYLETPM